NYMAIFYWLFGLTVAEVAVVYMSLPKGIMVALLISMAAAKAALVAMYFMHLRFEQRTLGLIALTPPALLVMFLVITYRDTAWRLFIH
ncbi:MAG TPA: cytochrome C oxidase subunit IV family protein, partial [Candidatus Acidoferrales bacterium]|nr:cytochrome C oxidase subunit IV family protein [Candidatus Acidoferrales bacterium]